MKNKEHKFKVGDKVRTTKSIDPRGSYVYPTGTICTVREVIINDTLPYLLQADGTVYTFWYAENMLELVESYDNEMEQSCELAVSPEAVSDPENYAVLLEPCPHCGSTTAPTVWHDSDAGAINITVTCDYNNNGCGASSGYYRTRGEAIENWNKRVCQCEKKQNSEAIEKTKLSKAADNKLGEFQEYLDTMVKITYEKIHNADYPSSISSALLIEALAYSRILNALHDFE